MGRLSTRVDEALVKVKKDVTDIHSLFPPLRQEREEGEERSREEVEKVGDVVDRLQGAVIPMVSTLKELCEKQHRGLTLNLTLILHSRSYARSNIEDSRRRFPHGGRRTVRR